MGKNKLRKFAEMETIPFVFQYPYARLSGRGAEERGEREANGESGENGENGESGEERGTEIAEVIAHSAFPLRGRWHSDFFRNDGPIILELGCGKGEYTVALAQRFPEANFIGIDIKGARMHTGATAAQRLGLTNVAFLRTSIELIEAFFAPGEIDHLWITFPDPQMKKVRKRLTSTRFLSVYRRLTGAGGSVRLKTDSPFLYTYTRQLVRLNALPVYADISDLYAPDAPIPANMEAIMDIRTHYERQWLERGLTIKYLHFGLPENEDAVLEEYTEEIPEDTYRSYSRGQVQCPEICPTPAVTDLRDINNDKA